MKNGDLPIKHGDFLSFFCMFNQRIDNFKKRWMQELQATLEPWLVGETWGLSKEVGDDVHSIPSMQCMVHLPIYIYIHNYTYVYYIYIINHI